MKFKTLTREEFLDAISKVDVELFRAQKDAVMTATIKLREHEKLVDWLDGLMNLLDVITDYIDPVATVYHVFTDNDDWYYDNYEEAKKHLDKLEEDGALSGRLYIQEYHKDDTEEPDEEFIDGFGPFPN